MKFSNKIAAVFACWLALESTSVAEDISLVNNPYASIAARNIFGLQPPPQTPVPDQPQAPVEVITANGVISIFGPLQVLFKVSAPAADRPDQEKTYILGEGQLQDDIELLKIDEDTHIFTFNNHGVIQYIPLAVVPNPNDNEHIFIGSHLKNGRFHNVYN